MPDRSRWYETFSIPRLWRQWTQSDQASLMRLGGSPSAWTTSETKPLRPGQKPNIDGAEIGATGTQNYGGIISSEDYNPKLDGRDAIKVYDEMRRSDAQVNAILQVMKLPLRSARWSVHPPEHGDEKDQAIADFCHDVLFGDQYMVDTWDYVLQHILMQLEFGFSVFELVFSVAEGTNQIVIKRMAPRLARTIHYWNMNELGQLTSVTQWAPKNGRFGYWTIPKDYLATFVLNREGDNWYGTSVLRSTYKHWYMKDQAYRIDAVRLDRFGVGIPTAELDSTYTPRGDELDKIEAVLKGMRTHEKAYLITPAGVKVRIMTPDGGRGGASDLMVSVEHHNSMIAQSVLAQFMSMGAQPHGSYGLGSALQDMFLNSLRGIAGGIAGDLNAQIVKRLCDLNFNMDDRDYPNVTVADLDTVDPATLTEQMMKLANVFLTPQDEDEAHVRKIYRLPPLDDDNTRKAKEEQAQEAAKQQAAATPPGTPPAQATPPATKATPPPTLPSPGPGTPPQEVGPPTPGRPLTAVKPAKEKVA